MDGHDGDYDPRGENTVSTSSSKNDIKPDKSKSSKSESGPTLDGHDGDYDPRK